MRNSNHVLWPEQAFPLAEILEWVAAKLDLPTSVGIEPTTIYASYTEAPDLRLTARLALTHPASPLLPHREVVLKANRSPLLRDSACAHALVSRHAARAVPRVLAWEEYPDGSSRLLYEPFEGRPIGDGDASHLTRTAEAMAAVQRAVAASGEAHGSGISRLCAEDVPAVFERVFSHVEAHRGAWETDEGGKLSASLRAPASGVLDVLAAARPQIRECGAVVSALGLLLTVDHGDLHAGNAWHSEGTVLIYDWETATVGCPLFSVEKLLVSAWRHDERPEGNGPWGYQPGTPTQARVRDAYLVALGRPDIKARAFAAAMSLAVVKEMDAEIAWANAMGWPDGNPEWTAQLLSRMRYHLQSV